jgi:hypothetical protein
VHQSNNHQVDAGVAMGDKWSGHSYHIRDSRSNM